MNPFESSESSPPRATGLQVELGAKSRRRLTTFWIVFLSIALAVLLVVVGTVVGGLS
jgi:hypothetical protein